jgi:hypothetical protein
VIVMESSRNGLGRSTNLALDSILRFREKVDETMESTLFPTD